MFSTHLGLLLGMLEEEVELDAIGVASMLISNASIGGSTPFKGVYRLQATEYIRATMAEDCTRPLEQNAN